MIRHKTLLMACAVVMLCSTIAPQKTFGASAGVDITEGGTYENYTNEANWAGFVGGVKVNRSDDINFINNTFRNNTNTSKDTYGIPGGGGVLYDWGGTLTIRDSIFDSNKSTGTGSPVGGGALMLYQTQNANISGTEFNNNSAAQNGGAVYFHQSKNVQITNSKFNGNTSAFGGGAIYSRNAENIEISNSEFIGNKVGELNEYNKYGGAIMLNGLTIKADSGITSAIHDCIFENNEASSGGAIYVGSSEVTFDNLTFNTNHARSGGAMMVSSGPRFGSGVTLNNSHFTGNTAEDNGGAIEVSGTLNVNNSDFTENTANSGGAMAIYGDEPVIVRESTFTGNTAETLGGAVYVHGGALDIHNSRFEGNHAKTRGGALATLSNTSSTSSMEVVRIINSDFINNKADQDGGAIHVNQNKNSSSYKLFQIVSEDGKTHEFTGNMHRLGEDMGTPESNAIYIQDGKVSLITRNDGSKLLFNDGIAGSGIDNAAVDVNGEVIFNAQVKNLALNVNGGELILNSGTPEARAVEEANILNNVDLTLNSGVFNMQNDKIDNLNIRNLTADVDGDVKIAFDADLSTGESDKFDVAQRMEGGLKFDAEHFDVKIVDGDNDKFQLFNRLDSNFSLIGDAIVQYTNNKKFTLTLGEDGYINVEKDTTNGLMDAIADEGVREFKLDPATDLIANKSLGAMNGEYLKINLVSQDFDGAGNEGITVAENQRLELVNLGSSIDNKAMHNFATENSGAVVNNAGELTVNNSIFKDNTAKVNGGVINNTGTVNIADSSFIDNKAGKNGGAIYNNGGKVTITADKKDVLFSGNTVTVETPAEEGSDEVVLTSVANDITMVNNGENKAQLIVGGNRTTTFNGGIQGEGIITKENNGNMNLAGDNSKFTGDVFYNGGTTSLLAGAQYFSAANTHFNNGAMLNLANNNAADKVNFGNLYMDGNGSLGLDVDMKSGQSDMIAAATVTGDGKLSIDKINILPDINANFTSMKFDFIEKDENGDSPLLDVVELNPYDGVEALGPIFRYGAKYDPATGQIILAGGAGKTSKNYNPAVLAGPVASLVGAYLTQLNTYDMAFTNIDMYMLMPEEQRKAMKLRNRYAATTDGIYSPTMNPYEEKGAWFKPYGTFENVKLNNGPRVSNVSYGSFFGGDSDLYELKHGFDGMYSIYGAYNGSHQSYNGNSIYQNGGTLGATGVLYKGNFFTGLTANVGANAGEASTMYGTDNFNMLMAGVASKTGYNWELARGKFIVQPNWLMSYSFVNTFDYRNAAGVDINSDPLNVLQLSPGLKFIGNFKHGWQPYAGLSIVWNIMDDTRFMANDVSLPELSLDPYFLYGFGIQKTAGERCTGYLQTMFRSGGRNGVGFQFGFRMTL